MGSRISEKCTNCGVCEPICPTKSILPGGRTYVVDSDTCAECLLCVPVCPEGAILNPLMPPRPKKKKSPFRRA